jgi:hypothetical protein
MKSINRFWRTGLLLAALGSANAWGGCSPIVIDLGNDGIHLGEAGVGVYFDVNADGVRDHVQWVRRGGDEGFLALDRTGNGIVDDGAELFGVGTPLILEGAVRPMASSVSRNTIRASSAATTTASSPKPTPSGRSCASGGPGCRWCLDRQEMRTLRSLGITALETIPKIRKYFDEAGNVIPYWAWAMQRRARGACSWSTCSSASCPRSQGHSRRTSATRVSTSSLRKI